MTALSVKLRAMPCRATQDGRVKVGSSNKTWSTGQKNGKPLQHHCLENPMNTVKRQKDVTLKEEPSSRSAGVQYATEKNGETTPEGMRKLNQSGNDVQLGMCLAMREKVNAIKNNIA